jgi:mRNA-degrading endonuclease RelE of RelBE toxin-antitoxin system
MLADTICLPIRPSLERSIDACSFSNSPRRHNNIKPLKGPFARFLRFRIGDWRVVYIIDEQAKLVRIYEIRHRSEVYE